MKIAEKNYEQVRTKVLDAAFERFAQFGFGKSTMAEIARDCNMSAGNLYRFFENKSEIGAACAQRCMEEVETRLREVVQRPGLGSEDRLELFVVVKINYLHEQFSEQPLHHELVQFVSRDRQDLVFRHLQVQKSLVAEILTEGNCSGEFDVADVLDTAEIFLAATMKFIAPHFVGMFPLEVLQKESRKVVKLLIKGLSKTEFNV